jgi:chaperonin cofactor prefoldin
MKAITTRQKLSVSRYLLTGSSFLETSRKTGLSIGSVSNIYSELREGSFAPVGNLGEQVDQLREMAVELKKSNLSPGRCLVGLIILSEINDCGLEPGDIQRLTSFIKSNNNVEDFHKYIEIVRRIADIEVKQGINIEELEEKVHDLETKVAELQPLIEQCEIYENEINILFKRKKELDTTLSHFEEKHKLLSRHVNNLERSENRLTTQLQALHSKLEKANQVITDADQLKSEITSTGLTIEELTDICQKVKSVSRFHKISPSSVILKFLNEMEKLDQGLDLEALIQANQDKIDEQVKYISDKQQEHTKLTAAIGSLKKEKLELESSIVEIKQKVLYEISKIRPSVTGSVNSFIEELKRSNTMTISTLKEQEAEHNKVILSLQKEELMIIQHINKTKQTIEDARSTALVAVDHVTQEMAKDIKTWGSARAELNAHLDDLKYAQYFTSFPLTRDRLDSLVDNITPPVIFQYLYITETFFSRNLQVKMKPPKWITKKYYKIGEYTDVELVDLLKWVREEV